MERQGGELEIKTLDHGIGRQGGGSLNKELDLRSWHCGRQRGGS